MLYEALLHIEQQLNGYFTDLAKENTAGNLVQLGSVVHYSAEEIKRVEAIFISVVNVAEDLHSKNSVPHRQDISGTERWNETPQLCFYALICVCLPDYKKALFYLDHVIRFFASQPVFVVPASDKQESAGTTDRYKLTLNLCPLSFEEQHYLWSSLGGKQYPSVVYKAGLTKMVDEKTGEKRDELPREQLA